MTGFRTMAGIAVAGLLLAACASRDLNNGNDQGYGDYGSNLHRQPYTLPSTAETEAAHGEEGAEAPAAEAGKEAEAPAATSGETPAAGSETPDASGTDAAAAGQ